jgi:hypothetical protein
MFDSSGLRSGSGRPDPAPTIRSAAASASATARGATSAAWTDRRVSCTDVSLHVWDGVADERRDVAADEHGVDTGALELDDVLA